MKYQDEKKFLIIAQTEQEISELKIQFKENNDVVLYLAQARELSDDNSYNTLIYFENNNNGYIFSEYENPAHASYNSDIKECSVQHYWEKLFEIDRLSGDCFFKRIKIKEDYEFLNKNIEEKNQFNIKKIKI